MRSTTLRCLLLLAAMLVSCMRTTTIPGPPREVIRWLKPEDNVRVTDKRRGEVLLTNVQVVGDSVIGVRSLSPRDRVAMSLDDIDAVAIREADLRRALIGTVLVVLALGALLPSILTIKE
jgi:hypothetical protein